MTRFHLSIAVVLVAALAAGGAAFAQGPRAGGPGGRGGGRALAGALPLASLDLTQAQQDLVRDIRERGREQGRQLDARLRDAHEAQRRAVAVMPIDEAAIRTATLALAEVQTEVAIHQARVQNEIFTALTAEQQGRLKQALAAREQQRQQRRQQEEQRPSQQGERRQGERRPQAQ
jgi:Spy/CpxP family protein refolding chaperone